MGAKSLEFRVYDIEILRYEVPAGDQEPGGGQGKCLMWREREGEA